MICKHFGQCGGCATQNIPYAEQVSLKEDKLSRLFNQRVAVIPSPKIHYYRNRMDFVCAKGSIGLREHGSFKNVVAIQECLLMFEEINDVLAFVNKLAQKHDVAYYDSTAHTGFLRYVVIREGKFASERMVSFVTNGFDHPAFPAFLQEFHQFFPIASVNWLVNTSLSDVSTGTVYKSLGKDHIIEKFNDIQYVIRPSTFFQTNSFAALLLFRDLKDRLKPQTDVLDLYCGVGAISLFVADRVKSVHGIELSDESVLAAQGNAHINQISNATFAAQDLSKQIELTQNYDTFIVDPPRNGMHETVLSAILAKKPRLVLSVSCNPETHKRDLDRLSKEYIITELRGYDFFPHTEHVETFAVLERKQ